MAVRVRLEKTRLLQTDQAIPGQSIIKQSLGKTHVTFNDGGFGKTEVNQRNFKFLTSDRLIDGGPGDGA